MEREKKTNYLIQLYFMEAEIGIRYELVSVCNGLQSTNQKEWIISRM